MCTGISCTNLGLQTRFQLGYMQIFPNLKNKTQSRKYFWSEAFQIRDYLNYRLICLECGFREKRNGGKRVLFYFSRP